MKFLFIFLAIIGALVVLKFAFNLVSWWAIFVGIVGFFVGYTMGKDSSTA